MNGVADCSCTQSQGGHSRLTHGFLMCGENPPRCDACDAPLSVQHIMRMRSLNMSEDISEILDDNSNNIDEVSSEYMMTQPLDSSAIFLKSESDVGDDSENMIVEHQVTTATSIQHQEDEQNPCIDADTNFLHIEIKSEGHAPFSYNDIDTQNKPSQSTDLLEETDKETSSSNLDKDKKSSSLNRIIKCDQCNFTTVNRKYFVIHLRRHTGERPFACDECDYSSVDKLSIYRHKKIHLAIKSYNCNICEFSSADRSNLIRHKKNHTGLKSFQCDKCASSFSHNRTLTRHQNAYHKPKPPEADALFCEFGPKRDFNSRTTDYNMQNPTDSEAMDVAVKVEIEEHPINVKPELDLLPTFDRNYVFLLADLTLDVDLHSASTTSVHLNQESDPFSDLPAIDSENVNEEVLSQLWDSSSVVVKLESEVTDEYINHNVYSDKSILEENLFEQKQKIGAETNKCHIEGDAAFSRNDNDPEAGPSQNIDPLNQSLLHPRDFLFSCYVCTYKCTSSRNFAKHKKHHSSENMFKCSLCEYSSPLQSDLAVHEQCHIGQEIWTCNLCSFRSAYRTNLTVHKQGLHPEVKKFQCSQCCFRSYQRRDLVDHLRKHSGERPFACDECSHRSSRRSRMVTHVQRHLRKKLMKKLKKKKLFQCNQCDFRSKGKSELSLHLHTHLGERPYVCDVCKFTCSKREYLPKRKKIHLEVKPHRCDKCGYSCVKKCHLATHKKNYHK